MEEKEERKEEEYFSTAPDQYNGENSDFEDDVVEVDFEAEIQKDQAKRDEENAGVGLFGEASPEDEDDEEPQVGMDIPVEYQEEVAQLFSEEEEPIYPDNLTEEDVVPIEYSPQPQYASAISGGVNAVEDVQSPDARYVSKNVEEIYDENDNNEREVYG